MEGKVSFDSSFLEVECRRCGRFYAAREGSRADRLDLCMDCLVKLKKEEVNF